eukprot:gene25884-5221_t
MAYQAVPSYQPPPAVPSGQVQLYVAGVPMAYTADALKKLFDHVV